VTRRSYDILVVGGGIAGVSIAAALGEHARVAVLERESQPAYHATGRSAALFSALYGPEPIRALSRASQAFLENPPEGFAEAPLVRRRGVLYVANADQIAAFEAFAATPDRVAAAHAVTPEAARTLCPLLRPGYAARALLEREAADIDVHGLLQGYLRRHRALGGATFTDAEVLGLSRQAGEWTARTLQGDFSAPVVINAAGAWADIVARMAGAHQVGLEPRRRTAVLVDPPEGLSVDAWPMVIDIEETFYFKPDAGLLLLSPADATPCDPCDAQPEELDVAIAIDRVETATLLQVRRVKHRWAGLRTFASDGAPVVGFDPEVAGFFWLAGQGGYGLQTAPALARTAAALVLGRALDEDLIAAGVDVAKLAPARFAC
jgi:D-arginine dehydrogenase